MPSEIVEDFSFFVAQNWIRGGHYHLIKMYVRNWDFIDLEGNYYCKNSKVKNCKIEYSSLH